MLRVSCEFIMLAFMSLRPRYSLLTLLVLTALVAGGVKLWYGPHHVVEWVSADVEDEYTYTRDWRGDKTIEGPKINRAYKDGKLLRVTVSYYRQGKNCEWDYQCFMKKPVNNLTNLYDLPMDKNFACPLSPAEKQLFDEARDREKAKLAAAKISYEVELEGHSIYYFFIGVGR